jgi:hypothetical protein
MHSCYQGGFNAYAVTSIDGNIATRFSFFKIVKALFQDEDSGKKDSLITRIALQPNLLYMRNQAALDGVFRALQKPSVPVDDYVLLKNAGFSLETLRIIGVDVVSLRVAGWSVRDLRLGGVTLKELLQSGCTSRSLFAAGFTAKELKDAGFSVQEMRSAGVDLDAFKSMGFDVVSDYPLYFKNYVLCSHFWCAICRFHFKTLGSTVPC